HIYFVSSVFLGLIILSVPLIMREELAVIKGRYINIIWTVIGIAFVVLLTYLNVTLGNDSDDATSLANLTFASGIEIFISAFFAICAMILPGISGSTLLLIFGLYLPVINAVRAIVSLDFSVLPGLLVLVCGGIVGLLTIVRVVRAALVHYRSQTVYLLIGFMLGSLYAIVMGPTSISADLAPVSISTFSIFGFILGLVIILALELLRRATAKHRERKAMEKDSQG
ncbi:MAG: DUF368 domain-containing protein, partial [Eggerthellaceae bacterium]|nr:DUF368 domain-containing protein [Eggerthellaceae bacterium]